MFIFNCFLSHAKLVETWARGILVDWLYLMREIMWMWNTKGKLDVLVEWNEVKVELCIPCGHAHGILVDGFGIFKQISMCIAWWLVMCNWHVISSILARWPATWEKFHSPTVAHAKSPPPSLEHVKKNTSLQDLKKNRPPSLGKKT